MTDISTKELTLSLPRKVLRIRHKARKLMRLSQCTTVNKFILYPFFLRIL